MSSIPERHRDDYDPEPDYDTPTLDEAERDEAEIHPWEKWGRW